MGALINKNTFIGALIRKGALIGRRARNRNRNHYGNDGFGGHRDG